MTQYLLLPTCLGSVINKSSEVWKITQSIYQMFIYPGSVICAKIFFYISELICDVELPSVCVVLAESAVNSNGDFLNENCFPHTRRLCFSFPCKISGAQKPNLHKKGNISVVHTSCSIFTYHLNSCKFFLLAYLERFLNFMYVSEV